VKKLVPFLLVAALTATALGSSPAVAGPPVPSISSFSPAQGPVGTPVTILGDGFQGTSSVSFNGTPATFVVVSKHRLDTTVPDGATTGHIRVVRGSESTVSSTAFTVEEPPPPSADLSVSVVDSADPIVADDTVTYTVSVHNAGPGDATDTVVRDMLPPPVIFSSATDGGTFDSTLGVVRWDVGTLAAGTDVSFSVTVQAIHPEFPMTDTVTAETSAPDPTTPNSATADTTVDAEQGVRYVSVADTGLTPPFRNVPLGGTVQWDFFGPGVHDITDAHGLGLFDSGPHTAVEFYRYTFDQTAEIRTKDLPTFPSNNGKIVVPVEVAPAAGTTGTQFTVTWALTPPATGLVVDVQIKRPGGSWQRWRHRQGVRTWDTFVPDAGAGTYSFRSRLRNVTNDAVSRFGPAVPVVVTA
jgi:uncharacterized repeat protein (TIGR01451 family)